MADALLSPVVGGVMWAVSIGAIAYSSRRIKIDFEERKVPLMGVLGAFIFAAQMINFSIPGTGSSGHLGGGILLSILLGPWAAFLTMAAILTIQALFFADGGLLALGCNIFNLGFLPALVAYPLCYKSLVKPNASPIRTTLAAILSVVIGLQLGALGVVLQTTLSGLSELPFSTFIVLMSPLHLAIGLVEGFVTAAIVAFILKARPEIAGLIPQKAPGDYSLRNWVAGFLALALILGGLVSWFASAHPDGLEWSITKVTQGKELKTPTNLVHKKMAALQSQTAFFPDYSFKSGQGKTDTVAKKGGGPRWDTSLAGIIGCVITLGIALLLGLLLRPRRGQIPLT